jgi:ABC-type polysaccharide/polyol phosphate export permease
MITMFRTPIYDGTFPPMGIVIPGTVIALTTLLVGWIYFSNKADEFAYKV